MTDIFHADDDATPLIPDEREDLIPTHITLRRELNELEQTNIAGKLKTLVRVRDHGPGVPDRMLSDIFVPFYRVQEQTGRDTQGAGLGLAIAERIVRMHEGSIRASNAPEGGLIVEMNLPTALP